MVAAAAALQNNIMFVTLNHKIGKARFIRITAYTVYELIEDLIMEFEKDNENNDSEYCLQCRYCARSVLKKKADFKVNSCIFLLYHTRNNTKTGIRRMHKI